MPKLTEEGLSAILERAISDGESFASTKLAQERRTVAKYYRGEEPRPMHKGDSAYVCNEVFETLDSVRSTISETFMGHQRIIYFQPEKAETVEEAKQATEYTRYVFFKQNNGEQIIYDSITDALSNRYSVVKVYYDEEKDDREYEFESLSEDELEQFVAGFEDYEFVEAEISDSGLYSGTVREARVKQMIRVEVLAPEDFYIAPKAVSLAKARFCFHKSVRTKSELLAEGFPEAKVNALTFESENPTINEYEKEERFDAAGGFFGDDEGYQDATRAIDVYEVYIRLDREGTGRAKLWKITYAGKTILDEEQISRFPFAMYVPIPIPHTWYGENFAARVIPAQNAKTVLTRQIINHSLQTNNARIQVLNGTVRNPSELIDNRFGGIVNVNRIDGIQPLPQGVLNPYVFSLIQKIDEDNEGVTGVSKLSQGLNKDAVSSQNSQGMVEQLISASERRQKMMARRFGLFMREVYHLIYSTAVDYIEQDEYVSVTGSYVPVNPIQWKDRKAASIELGLGYGEQEQEAAKYVEIDQYFSQDPQLAPGYGYDKRYEVLTRALERRGIEDIEAILTRPADMKPPEPSEAEILQLEMLKAQIAYTNAQAAAMTGKASTDQMNAMTQQGKVVADNQVKAEKMDLEESKLAHQMQIDWAEVENAKTADKTSGVFSPRGS